MNDDDIKEQINALIRDEIQDTINDYVEAKEVVEESGLGFVEKEDEKELKVSISQKEIDNILKEYKKIKVWYRTKHLKSLQTIIATERKHKHKAADKTCFKHISNQRPQRMKVTLKIF